MSLILTLLLFGWHRPLAQTDQCSIGQYWTNFSNYDAVSGRFVIAMGNYNVPAETCATGIVDVSHAGQRPPGWPWQSFCIDTFHFSDKTPIGGGNDLDGIAGMIYDGIKPSMMVIFDNSDLPILTLNTREGTANIGPLCFGPGQFPHIQFINHWNQGQHMYGTFAGVVR